MVRGLTLTSPQFTHIYIHLHALCVLEVGQVFDPDHHLALRVWRGI
jgi:hypothetical protein